MKLKGKMKKTIALIMFGIWMSAGIVSRAPAEDWKQQFAKAADEYFDQVYFPYRPDKCDAHRVPPV